MNDPHNLPYELLVDLAEGRLSSAEQRAARARIAGSPAAAAELAALERLISLMRSDESADAPDHVLNRAIRLLRPRQGPDLAGALRRVVASLRFDSLRAPLASGVRSGQPEPVRQILLVAEDREIDLRVSPAGGAWRIDGQVLGPEEGGEVRLEGPASSSASLNELSEFSLPPIPAGSYRLLLRQGELEIVIDDLEIGQAA